MRNSRNSLIILSAFGLFIVIGCNFGKSETSENSIENSSINSSSADSETADGSEITVPDIDFPKGEEPPEGTTEASKSRMIVVKFEKGGTSRQYSSKVAEGAKHTFTLSAAKGQTMKVDLSNANGSAVFYINKPSGGFLGDSSDKEPNDNFNGELPESGKYSIVVGSTKGESTYKISFSVTGETAPNKDDSSATVESVGGLTTVVKFRKGGTSAAYKNAVIRGERNKYILGASAGQMMSVSISSLENNAVFDIQSPRGKIIVREVRDWSGQLSEKGKYRIIVGGTRGNATYTVRFAVQ